MSDEDAPIDPMELVASVLTTLTKQLDDIGQQFVVLTRDEALITASLVGTLEKLLEREKEQRGQPH